MIMNCRICGSEMHNSWLIDGKCQLCYNKGYYLEYNYNYKCKCGGEFNTPIKLESPGIITTYKCPFCGKQMIGLSK